MESPLKSLISDTTRYLEAFNFFKGRTNAYQSMNDFIDGQLPDILASIVDGKSHLKVIGVGSGSGDIDVKILSMLHLKNPEMTVDNEVVEPSSQQLRDYRDLVSQTPGLDYVNFNWNEMTSEEFEEHWKEKKMTKKADLIHMFQVLYFVKDVEATVNFFLSLLDKNGKLLITLQSDKSGVGKLVTTYGNKLSESKVHYLTTAHIKRLLDSMGLSYQIYELQCQMDITECFIEGNEKRELLLDFITDVLHFSKSASPELKADIIKSLCHPDCSQESNDKVMLNHNYEMIVVEKLT